jgi:NhaA family Na+:H+ antiporter
VATDIAFAIGILSLLGTRIPPAARVFMLALAIFDDLGAIVVIAIFYTAELSLASLAAAAAVLVSMLVLNRIGMRAIAPYLLLGIALWVCVLRSGVHATLAGVVVALAIPIRERAGDSPLRRLEEGLHPWVAFAITPLFGFANAGVSLSGLRFSDLIGGIGLGTAAGLFAGKQIGIFLVAVACLKLGLARAPEGVGLRTLHGLSVLAGVGFTMSLFIGTLAYPDPAHLAQVRQGVLLGSLLSGACGYALLRWAPRAS